MLQEMVWKPIVTEIAKLTSGVFLVDRATT